MKFFTSLLFLFVFFLPSGYAQLFSSNCDGGINILPLEDVNICNNSNWILIFEDNFDGDSLDLGKWRNISQPGSLQGGDHQNVVTLRNAIIEDGYLNLIAKKERVQELVNSNHDSLEIFSDGLPNYRWFDYTAGLIWSQEKFGYGYFEASCKVPSGKGIWPAMWMFGGFTNQYNVNVSQEIDVFEFWKDRPDNLNMNVHYDGEACLTDYNGPDFSKEFHTYGLLWEPYKIEWYLDGELIRTYPRFFQNGSDVGCVLNAWQPYQETPFPKGKMSLIFNIAVDNREGHKPDNTTLFPSYYQIDWIRYSVREDLKDFQNSNIFYANIYPNPTQELLSISITSSHESNYQFEIYNLQSGLIISKRIGGSFNDLDVSFLENGVYIVKVKSQTTFQEVYKRLIISK